MKKATGIFAIIITATILTGCSQRSVPPVYTPIPTAIKTGTNTPFLPIQTITITPSVPSTVPLITDISWNQDLNTIGISMNPWPHSWPWKMYLDGKEIPMEGRDGKAVVRPNAPLEQPPNGLFVGSLPWVTGLDNTDFPCCGTIQFDIPGEGLSNIYEYDFGGLCKTKSIKACVPEWMVHEGDLVLSGTEKFSIENTKYKQNGNIYIRDMATLTIKNSELDMERGTTPTIHVYIFVDPQATLNIENSRVYGSSGDGLACVINRGIVKMIDSPTAIHYLDMSEGAQLKLTNSELVNNIGGILQIGGGDTNVTDSTLGALGLTVPNGGHLSADGIKSGTYFSSFDVHELIPDANYDLVLKNTNLLQDFPSGPLEHGPYERGWILFLNKDSHVNLSNSELRKIFLDIEDGTASFHDLRVGVPVDLEYRDISLKNIIVSGEWPFTIHDSNLTIDNSNYLFLQPSGSSTIRLNNSHMVEFIPRDFSGTMIFENATWTTAGEILGAVPYHSDRNSFRIAGSLKIADELRVNLQWKNALVTREYDVIVTDSVGNPIGGAIIKIGGQAYMTDNMGKTKFNIDFDETNYNKPLPLEAWQSDVLIARQQIDFFTETPIRLGK